MARASVMKPATTTKAGPPITSHTMGMRHQGSVGGPMIVCVLLAIKYLNFLAQPRLFAEVCSVTLMQIR